MDDKYIFAWPDGTWCYADELEDMLQSHSDDYVRIDMSDCSDTPDRVVEELMAHGVL